MKIEKKTEIEKMEEHGRRKDFKVVYCWKFFKLELKARKKTGIFWVAFKNHVENTRVTVRRRKNVGSGPKQTDSRKLGKKLMAEGISAV